MAIKYEPGEHAIYCENNEITDKAWTETEHKDSCDINLMLKNAAKGVQVRTGQGPIYGFDDTTMDPVTFRNEMQTLQQEMGNISENMEFTEEEIQVIPEKIKKQFKFKTKKIDKQNDAIKNDDKTTKNVATKNSQPNTELNLSKDDRSTVVKADGPPVP